MEKANRTATVATKDWAEQISQDENEMTLDEYKRQREFKKKADTRILPKFNIRAAGEGEDPRMWRKPQWIYRKTKDDDKLQDESEENGKNEEKKLKNESISAKNELISIPLASEVYQLVSAPNSYDFTDQQYKDDEHQGKPTSSNQQQQTLIQHPYLCAQLDDNYRDQVSD